MLEISRTISIAIGCVMASGLDSKSKKEVINTLRAIEEEHNSKLEFLKIAKQSPLDYYKVKELE